MTKLLVWVILLTALPVYAAQMDCVENGAYDTASTADNSRAPFTATCHYINGDRYVGQIKGGNTKDGKGTYYYASGGRYEGEWKDNRQDGQGTHF